MKPTILITGGAGFIGTNLAHRLLSAGHPVRIFDNLSRRNVERNLKWLMHRHADLLQFEFGDVRNRKALKRVIGQVEHVFHLAAQVAVTTSVEDPIRDFETNVTGTLNVLEEIRSQVSPPSILYTSTNKVYGALEQLSLKAAATRYVQAGGMEDGVDETCPLSFHSPYGCSKGAAEQYVLDYHRTYGIKSVVFRMSCIYGPHQYGNEDQGWVAHIMARALAGDSVTIYGDGLQVRDILYVEDLVDAMLLAFERIDSVAGNAFNIGGSPTNTISLNELLSVLHKLNLRPPMSHADWRIGDQKYYVSNTNRFSEKTGWRPNTRVETGLRALHEWLIESQSSPINVLVKETA
jgi:CDP-paratose 2-epimerase